MTNYAESLKAIKHAKDGTVQPEEAQVLATLAVAHAVLAVVDELATRRPR